MSTFPALDELPTGYFVEESPRGVLALHIDVARVLHDVGFGPESDGRLECTDLSGRRPMYEIRSGGEAFVLRRSSHGGLMRWITGERFLDAQRPFRELILSDSLRRLGVPTPHLVAARARRAGLLGWRLDVLTRRVDNSIDLGYVLAWAERESLRTPVKRRLLAVAGELVRKLHVHGCVHADLSPNNMLVPREALEGDDASAWILDLDRSFFVERLDDDRRRSNLNRLYRHVKRRERARGSALARTDYARFLRSYQPDRARRRADWRAIDRLHAASRVVHAIGWVLERVFARAQDPRGALRPQRPRSADRD